MEVKQVFMNSLVPKHLARQAAIKAAVLGMSRSELIRVAVSEYLKKLETTEQERNHAEQAA